MKIRVNPHTVEIVKEQSEPINEREIKVSKCEFEFDEAITSDFVKEAYFTLNGNTYKMIVENNECDYPSEVLAEKGTLEIGVVAFKVENGEEIIRYNPSPDYFESWVGSLKDAENSEPITPSEMEQFEQELQEGLNEIDNKIDEVDDKIAEVDTAITETNNLDLDVSNKVDGDVTVTLTKKDASTKSVVISDGTSLQFMWQGTSLGIKTDDMSEYVFVDLQGVQGVPGPKGDAFQIKKTYPTVEAMNADFNNMELGDYVMIASEVSIEDNAKLYTRGQNAWIFISDFSGSQGIKGETGATPNIQIGTVTSGSTPSVTRTGTNENPVLNFVLQPGPQGDTGPTGPTGNGIDHISLTSQSGATKVYTIYFTDGNTTTFTVEDGEVTQEVFDEEVDRLKMIYNAMPKVSDEGTDLTLNNTAECPVYDIELSPSELEQESTSGKNLLDLSRSSLSRCTLNSDGSLTSNISNSYFSEIEVTYLNDYILSKKGETITFSTKQGITDKRMSIIVNGTRTGGTSYQEVSNTIGERSVSLTIADDFTEVTSISLRFNRASTRFDDTTTIVQEAMLEQNSTATSYEPFTYGPSPNPQYPQEIHVVSGENSVKVQNKNLFDKDNANILKAYFLNDTIASTLVGRTIYIECKANTTYTISKILSARFAVAYTTELPQIGSSIYNYIARSSATDITITTGEDAMYFVAFIYSSSSDTLTLQEILDSIQIEVSNSATTYVKHQEQSLPLSLGNLEYCKIGDYEDEFYLATESDTGLTAGKWYLKKNVGKVVLDGSENWFDDGGGAPFALRNTNVARNNSKVMVISDYFRGVSYNSSWSAYDYLVSTSSATASTGYLKFKYLGITALADFKTWLSEYNPTIYYVLATPQNTLLSDTLQTQLDNIQKAISYQDQTNVSQTNADLPFVIKLSAIRDLSGIFEEI